MKRRYFIALWIVLIGVGIIAINIKKKSLFDFDYSAIANTNVRLLWDRGGEYINEHTSWRFDKAISLENISDRSNIVVRVKAISSRGKNNCALTTVEIVDVIKGNIEAGNSIDIYEWGEIWFENIYFARDGYVIMRPKQEYVLFLQTFENKYSSEIAYLLTNIFYGKIAIDYDENVEIMPNEAVSDLAYAQIQNYGIISQTQDILDRYREISKTVKYWKKGDL
jgi:hypothetical protein